MALLRRRTKTDDVPRAGPYAPGWEVPARFNFTRDVVDALAANPVRPALTFVDREGIVDRRTFHDVSQDAARWAHLLRIRVDRGDRVVIAVGKTPAWHGALLGALKSGVVAVPCPDMLRARDLAFRVLNSGARLVIADRSLEPEIEEMRHQVGATVSIVYLDDALEELRRYMPVAPTEDTTAGERALILYTSGTTKDPKGVVHTHAYTWAQRAQATHWLDAHEGDVVWCTAGSGWAKAIWNVLLGPWSHGAEVVLHEGPFDPEERLSLLQRLGVTVLCQAPTEYRMLAKLDTLGAVHLPRLRHAVSAGEPLNPEVIARFQDALGLTVHDGYGQTENSLLVANAPGTPIRPGSMGLPTPGHDVAVIDETGHVCPHGVEGDLALIGRPPTLFTGYWDAPEETDAVFRDGWYLTGDRATRDEDGYLWFVGRADDVIVSAAYRIGPFEVESALLEHPAVAESAVVGVPDLDRGQIVKAFVVLRSGHEPGPRLAGELQEHVKAVTAPYKYPRVVAFVDELPKTASGKTRRSELRLLPDDAMTFTGPTLSVVREPATEAPEPVALETAEAARQEAADKARLAAEEARQRAEAAERVRAEVEAATRREAEERARAEAEEAARLEDEAAERAHAEQETAARREAEERARAEAEETARREAEAEAAERARAEAEERARAQAAAEEAERARAEAEATERARAEAEEAARREAEERSRAEAEAAERARVEAEAAERAQMVAEAEERARAEAEEAARREAEERARAEAEAAERARADAEAEERARAEAEEAERARAEAEEATRREAEAAEERARAEEAARREAEEAEAERARAAAETAALIAAPTESELEPDDELDDDDFERGIAELDSEARESRREARRRRKEEKAAAKRQAEEDKAAAKRRAEEERLQAKADAEQRKREDAAAREAERSRLAQEKVAEKQRAEDERRRAAEEKVAAKKREEDERRRKKDEAKAARRSGFGRLFGADSHDEYEDEDEDATQIEPIPDIVERLRYYSREQATEPGGDEQPPASHAVEPETRTIDTE